MKISAYISIVYNQLQPARMKELLYVYDIDKNHIYVLSHKIRCETRENSTSFLPGLYFTIKNIESTRFGGIIFYWWFKL